MKFLCAGYLDPEAMNARPQDEIEAIMSECGPHLEELYKTGRVVVDAGLGSETRNLRLTGGKLKVTDGPFTESKEMIGSAFIVEAEDMEEAVRLASLHPTTRVAAGERFGWRIEVRPIHYFKGAE